ncbi:AMP-binding protein [Bradyrhizobium sp. BR 10261]|uniref:AMP-binding protein n=1 Tax=Bradyrhizobium sp. BR 10261 TaxID=2749992 RepID=UPI001C64CECB|nr:AMP-binding protein [Bradyrhizobium sp. BR 10261]MBW7965733.1 AMP-binding protein [Bradyrhizobium sp. BR 10261]
MPFHQQLHHHAAATPDKPAFIIDGKVRSFAELENRSQLFWAYVASLPGGRKELPILNRVDKVVALDLGNHLLFPELFVGATRGNNVCAVLDPKMLPSQLQDILTRLRPDLIVTETTSTSVADIARRMGFNVETADAFVKPRQGNPPADPKQPPETEDGTFLVNFTSGTTSQPKAYSRSRAAWRASLARGVPLFGLQDAPATMCPGALAHGLALYSLAETLHSGGTFHTVKQWNADLVANALSRGDIDRLVAVPTMVSALAERVSPPSPVFPSIRDVLTAGAKLSSKHVALMRSMFPQARIMEYYGASELGFVSVSTVHPSDPETPIGTVGKAYPGVEISVRRSEQMLGDETAGTIYVKSDLICDGYLWGDDGKAFRVDSSGATVGDIGELKPNGALTVMGREGGMLITGGFNVYVSEVEAVLKNIAEVDEAVVLGVDDAYLGTRLVAILCGSFEGGKGILEEAGKSLPRYKIPRDLYRTSSWPMTTSGKIARGKIAELLQDGQYDSIELTT